MKSQEIIRMLDSILEEPKAIQNISSLGPEDIVKYIRLYLSHTGSGTSNFDVDEVIERLLIDASPKQKVSLNRALELLR